METKQRGRKAGVGTHEARKYVEEGRMDALLTNINLSPEATARIIKAVRFGLGIKKEEV